MQKKDEKRVFVLDIKKKAGYKTPSWLKKHCWSYNSLDTYIYLLRDGIDSLRDYIWIYGVPFTMHEYDCEGKQISYANKKLGLMIEINWNSNRYKNMADIGEYDIFEAGYLRNDITYLQ